MSSEERAPRRLIERDDLRGDAAKVARLLRDVDVPRSSPGARARVWARLHKRAPSKLPYVIAAVSGASLAMVVMTALRAIEPEPEIVQVIGGAGVAIEQAARPDARLVRSKSASRVAIGAMVSIDLAPETELIARPSDGAVLIELLAGGIVTEPLRGAQPHVSITSLPYTIKGEGISTRVIRTAGGGVEIEILSGEGRLVGPDVARVMRTGDEFESGEKVESAEKVETQSSLASPERAPEPKPRLEPERRPPPRARKKPPERIDPAPVVAEEPDSTPPIEPPVEPPIEPPVEPPLDWAALYRQAREERDPERALSLFDRLAASDSAFAEVSAFQAARIEMRRNRCGQAIDRFRALIGGTFDSEARLDVIECQLQIGDLVAAQRSLTNFLETHPGSERESDLRFLRAELMRKRDRCSEAIPDYEAAHESRHADDALYFTAWCKLQVGRTEEGLAALRAYLDRFPNGRHANEAKKKL